MGNTNKQNEDIDYLTINEEKLKNIKSINLIKEVKSRFNIKLIFSFLEQKLKREIIRYNKKYQNLFNINIDDYKKDCKIIRIMEKNGFGKEYTLDKNRLIFEGEFKNGKKNGKGTEYFVDGIEQKLFEGTYLNGKRHGKGIEYHRIRIWQIKKGIECNQGKIRFKGEYSNGYKIEGKGYDDSGKLEFKLERNGIGKEYYFNGKLSFKGQFINGKKNGKGKQYHENGKLQYDGEYKDGLLNGKVKEYDDKGKLIFEGEFKDDKRWKGRADDEEFQGEYLNGKKWNGKAIEYECYGDPRELAPLISFEGEYINGEKKGFGFKYSCRNKIYSVTYNGGHEYIPDYEDYDEDNKILDDLLLFKSDD